MIDTGWYLMTPNNTKWYLMLSDYAWHYLKIPSDTWGYQIKHDYTRWYLLMQNYSRLYLPILDGFVVRGQRWCILSVYHFIIFYLDLLAWITLLYSDVWMGESTQLHHVVHQEKKHHLGSLSSTASVLISAWLPSWRFQQQVKASVYQTEQDAEQQMKGRKHIFYINVWPSPS